MKCSSKFCASNDTVSGVVNAKDVGPQIVSVPAFICAVSVVTAAYESNIDNPIDHNSANAAITHITLVWRLKVMFCISMMSKIIVIQLYPFYQYCQI